MLYSWIRGWCVLHQNGSSNFEFETSLQGHMVWPELGLCRDFLSWVWGCCVLHQIVSSNFESKACLQGHMVEPELGFYRDFPFMSMKMLCLASDCELEFWVWSLLARPHGLAWAGLVLKVFWVESRIVGFCTKRSTLLRRVSASRPLQGLVMSSGGSIFFWCIFHP
jgi:hypothetical protein